VHDEGHGVTVSEEGENTAEEEEEEVIINIRKS